MGSSTTYNATRNYFDSTLDITIYIKRRTVGTSDIAKGNIGEPLGYATTVVDIRVLLYIKATTNYDIKILYMICKN